MEAFWILKKPLSWIVCLFTNHGIHFKITSVLSLMIFAISIFSELMEGLLTPDDFRHLMSTASGSQLIILSIAYIIFRIKSRQ